jgi:hypothetical protein
VLKTASLSFFFNSSICVVKGAIHIKRLVAGYRVHPGDGLQCR